MTDVVLAGSEHNADFAAALSKNHLKFGFQDGKITDVCNEVNDPMWVVNFKKGVLSTFQNSYKKEVKYLIISI